MANCNCIDFPISCAPHAPGGDCCHTHGCPPHPCPPPPFKGGTSMYIGARYVPIFADPVEWDDEREYEPLTIVVHNGDCYTSKCYVPKGSQLPPYPEGQTKYWVKTSDYNYQFADLKKTVTDLSRLVEQFQKDNKDFTDLINNWNEKVQQWETEMTAWGERLDTVESHVTDLTASLNAEIDRAKAAEQANAAAIAQETADRKQAISDLDAAYKAADAAEAQARAEADTALSNRITTNTTDIDAIKAEQVIQNTNISANAKNISDNAAEIAKHAARLTDLESNASDWDDVFPDTTIAQEVQKEENARANGDTALNGRCDAIAADVEEVRDIANHKVDQTAFNAADALNVKYVSDTKKQLNTQSLEYTTSPTTRNSVVLGNVQGANNLANFIRLTPFAYKTETDTAQAAADKANTNIGDWETDHPNQTISQCATSVENEIAAVDAKADANSAALANKADKSEIPDVSGFVTTQTYTQGQAAQDAKIDANTAALANKADKSEILDVSGFVTTQTYTQGQAAQDAKIDDLTGKLADINYLAFLDALYPEGSEIPGAKIYDNDIFFKYYPASWSDDAIRIPLIVPPIVAKFPSLWTANIFPPTNVIQHKGDTVVTSRGVKSFSIDTIAGYSEIFVVPDRPFPAVTESGVYSYTFNTGGPSSDSTVCYKWTKNATPFTSLETP